MDKGLLPRQMQGREGKKSKVQTKIKKKKRKFDFECKTDINPVPEKIAKKCDAQQVKTEAAKAQSSVVLNVGHRDSGFKTNKRKRTEDGSSGQTLKKCRKEKDKCEQNTAVVHKKGTNDIMKLTRKQRRNRKKNNSKKNKYKHLDFGHSLNKRNNVIDKNTKASHLLVEEDVNRLDNTSKVGKLSDILYGEMCEGSNAEISQQTLQGDQNDLKSKHMNVSMVKENTPKKGLKKKKTVGTFQKASSTTFATKSSSDGLHVSAKVCTKSNAVNHEVDTVHEGKRQSKKVSLPVSSSADKTLQKSHKQSKTLSVVDKAHLKLDAARFRYLNEQLYTSSGKQAFAMFENDPEAFKVYHQGFQVQVSKWPVNPLDVIIKELQRINSSAVIADFGCGDATLAEQVSGNKVHSFDLVASKPCVTACDIARVPLEKNSVDIAVFCLSLMGTNLSDYLCEANRVLLAGGTMKIAEVVSRFFSVSGFVRNVEALGFHLQKKQLLGKMFLLFNFKKVKDAPPRKQAPRILLKACHYKRR